MNNNILAIVFLVAGTLLTTTAVTTMVPVVYADDDHDDHDKDNHDKRHDGKDGDVNKAKAEDQSVVALASCDNNKNSGTFSCFPSVAFSHSNTFP
jgi:hypothetical protein